MSEFDDVVAAVGDTPFMTPEHGRRVFEHVQRTRPVDVLELGTAHGVSASYIAGALEANGFGHLVTVDHGGARYDPSPEEVLARTKAAQRVTIVRQHSSYNWFLKERVEEASDEAGNVTPMYDFCYLDGSKNFNIDGLAVVLVEKLLRPGGWLLMDDLGWSYTQNVWIEPEGNGRPLGPMSDDERRQPHLRWVFDLIVRQLPGFTQFVIEDEWFGWAQKAPGEARRYELKTSRPLAALLAAQLRHYKRRRSQAR